MTAALVSQLMGQLDGLGWDYQHTAQGGEHRVTLAFAKMDGAQLVQLFTLLNPAANPGVSVSLEASRGITIV